MSSTEGAWLQPAFVDWVWFEGYFCCFLHSSRHWKGSGAVLGNVKGFIYLHRCLHLGDVPDDQCPHLSLQVELPLHYRHRVCEHAAIMCAGALALSSCDPALAHLYSERHEHGLAHSLAHSASLLPTAYRRDSAWASTWASSMFLLPLILAHTHTHTHTFPIYLYSENNYKVITFQRKMGIFLPNSSVSPLSHETINDEATHEAKFLSKSAAILFSAACRFDAHCCCCRCCFFSVCV